MKKRILIVSGNVLIIFSVWMLYPLNTSKSLFKERVKVSLREVGNKLLLMNQDTTSLILPVIALTDYKYQLSFQRPLSFEPSNLVATIDKSFKKASLPSNYLVETVQCEAQEVAYSYQVFNSVEKNIIPCVGRYLPERCYKIEVQFTDEFSTYSIQQVSYYSMFLGGFILVFFGLYYKSQETTTKDIFNEHENYIKLGSYHFYPEQNKLVKQSEEIKLSKKECELLEIFADKPNQVIKRDELTKQVWEDHGVFVGRSLDTYISKLRKKLNEDNSIKITNIHGVGYKLELT